MDEMKKNKMDDMEMGKVSGGKISPWHPKAPRPRPGFHDSNANSMAANIMGATENANSMAANIDETQNARWREIAKVKPD